MTGGPKIKSEHRILAAVDKGMYIPSGELDLDTARSIYLNKEVLADLKDINLEAKYKPLEITQALVDNYNNRQ